MFNFENSSWYNNRGETSPHPTTPISRPSPSHSNLFCVCISCKIKIKQRRGEKMWHRCPFRFAANCFLGIYYYFYLGRMRKSSNGSGHCGCGFSGPTVGHGIHMHIIIHIYTCIHVYMHTCTSRYTYIIHTQKPVIKIKL